MPLAPCSQGRGCCPRILGSHLCCWMLFRPANQDLGHLWGLMTCQKWCLIYGPGAAAEHSHEHLGRRGFAALHCLWWSILKEASPPFPFAPGGLQRPLQNFKGCLLKLLKVRASSKRLLSFCKGVQGDVPGGVGSLCSW